VWRANAEGRCSRRLCALGANKRLYSPTRWCTDTPRTAGARCPAAGSRQATAFRRREPVPKTGRIRLLCQLLRWQISVFHRHRLFLVPPAIFAVPRSPHPAVFRRSPPPHQIGRGCLLCTERHFTDYLGLWLERGSLSPNRHSLWLWGCCPHWATAPSTAPPPSGGPSRMCHWSSGNLTYHSP
jgi:hypothetical protein